MAKAQRIAIFLPTLHGGGAERNMVNLAHGLAAMGRDVTIVAAHAVGAFRDELNAEITLVDLNCPRVFRSLIPLANFLRQNKPDVLLSTMNHANVVAILAANMQREPIPVFVREANTLSITAANADSAREAAVPILAQWFYPRATTIIAPSTGVHDDLVQNFGMPEERSVVIYNPVVDDALAGRAAEEPSHDLFGDAPVILGCGSFSAQKDFPVLIRAFASVRAKRDARLVILGEGKLKPVYERLVAELGVEDDVFFPGFVSNPFAFMSRSAVFVLSSKWEGLPNVPIQALACGCPVVSTDCPSGPREILMDGKYGELVPVGKIDAIADAIERTLDDPPTSDKLRERANSFTVEAIAQQYAALFDEV